MRLPRPTGFSGVPPWHPALAQHGPALEVVSD
jgi:hypothetical protein